MASLVLIRAFTAFPLGFQWLSGPKCLIGCLKSQALCTRSVNHNTSAYYGPGRATRQIIRAGGSIRPQQWGKRGAREGEEKLWWGGHRLGHCWGSSCCSWACWSGCIKVVKSGFTCVCRQSTNSSIMLGMGLMLIWTHLQIHVSAYQ